jgi:hypothetical protein
MPELEIPAPARKYLSHNCARNRRRPCLPQKIAHIFKRQKLCGNAGQSSLSIVQCRRTFYWPKHVFGIISDAF